MALSECSTFTDQYGRELKEHGTALFPIACYEDDLRVVDVPWHWHEELEAGIVTRGSAVVATDREQVTLCAGDGFILNGNVLHAAWMAGEEPCELHSLVFHPKLVGGGMESVFWQKYLLPITDNSAFRILPLRGDVGTDGAGIACIRKAWLACVEEPAGYEFVCREELSRMILFLRGRVTEGTAPVSGKRVRDEQRVKAMLTYIREHLSDESLCIRQIAQAAAVSESECIRCFRATIGETPIQYVKQLRLQRAAELLTESDQKIVEIGFSCGFQEMSYFARSFRAQYGLTPSQYRAAAQKRQAL